MTVCLLVSVWSIRAQDILENEVGDKGEGEGITRPISDERRRERLRSFFTRRREESLKSSSDDSEEDDDEAAPASPSTRSRTRFIRPRVTTQRPATTQQDDDDEEFDLAGFSTEKVSVSISKSVSTSVSRRAKPITRIFNRRKEQEEKEEEEAEDEESEEEVKERPSFTQKKRFRLVKTPSRSRGSLVERVLENIDKQNEIDTTGERRIRFRPSIRRENIRKKVQAAVNDEPVKDERVSTTIADSTTVAGTTITDPEPVTQESIVSQTLPPQILGNINPLNFSILEIIKTDVRYCETMMIF